MKLEYVLPWGDSNQNAMQTYQLQGGLVTNNSETPGAWNPLESGSTIAFVRQFNRFQEYQSEEQTLDGSVHGLEFGVMYDHTDF